MAEEKNVMNEEVETEEVVEETTEETVGETAEIDTSALGTSKLTELGEYKGITYKPMDVTVSEEEIEAEVQYMLSTSFTKDPQEVATETSVVNIDYVGKKDGVAFDGGTAEGYDLEIGSHTFIEGFEDQIIGHNIGEEFDINVMFPEQYHAPELAGQPAVFTIKLNGIQKTEMYDMGDVFAQEVFGFENLAELQNGLKAEMLAVREAEAITAQENAAVDKVLANAKMQVPQEMIALEADRMVRELDLRLQSQGMSLEAYLKIVGMTEETLKQDVMPQAEKSVQTRLVLDEIAKVEDIQVTEEDMEAEYAKFAAMYQTTVEEVKELLANNIAGLRKEIAAQKAIDLIIREAKF